MFFFLKHGVQPCSVVKNHTQWRRKGVCCRPHPRNLIFNLYCYGYNDGISVLISVL